LKIFVYPLEQVQQQQAINKNTVIAVVIVVAIWAKLAILPHLAITDYPALRWALCPTNHLENNQSAYFLLR